MDSESTSQSVYVKIVGNEFQTVTDLVNQIIQATGLSTDKIKPSNGQVVAFLSNGDSGRIGDNRFSR